MTRSATLCRCIVLGALVTTTSGATRLAPPSVAAARTRRLLFVAATPAHGSLAEQVRMQLTEIGRAAPASRIVKLRIFTYDADRSEAARLADAALSEHGRSAVLSVVGVVGFPDSAQRVQIEGTIESASVANRHGVAFLAGVASSTAERSIGALARIAAQAGVASTDIERVSCFYEQAAQANTAPAAVSAAFPNAKVTLVQSRDATERATIECEAAGRASRPSATEVSYFNALSVAPSPFYSHATIVAAPRLLFSAGFDVPADPAAARAGFSEIERALRTSGGDLADVVMANNYWGTDAGRDVTRQVRGEFYGATVPAATGVLFSTFAGARGAAAEVIVAVRSRRVDTLTLAPTRASVDGRYLTPHVAELLQVTQRRGQASDTQRFELHKSLGTDRGRGVFRVNVLARTATDDTTPVASATLDRRTLAIVAREARTRDGARTALSAAGRAVLVRTWAAGRSTPVESQLTLPSAAFHAAFADAAINGAVLRDGLVLRVPTFSAATGNRIDWRTFRVIARDSVRTGARVVPAWVVEERPGAGVLARRLWLSHEAPFFPRDVTYFADSTRELSQRVLDSPTPS